MFPPFTSIAASSFRRSLPVPWLGLILGMAVTQVCFCGCATSRPLNLADQSRSIDRSGPRVGSGSPRSVFNQASAQTTVVVRRVSPATNDAQIVTVKRTASPVQFKLQTAEKPPFVDDGGPICLPVSMAMFDSEPIDLFFSSESKELSVRRDVHELPNRFMDELDALLTLDNAAFLGLAGGVAAVVHNNVDAQVFNSGPRWGNVSDFITDLGESFHVQLPAIGGMYAFSLCTQNDDLHELSLTMFTTYKFTLLSSVALQYATGTHHSSGGFFNAFVDSGFPSEHTATTFALAAILDEAFGWEVGLPAYLLSGVIGWAEIDQNQHTVSDVLFGAALGYVIGKSIGSMHYRPDARCKLIPLVDPYSRTQGMGIEFAF